MNSSYNSKLAFVAGFLNASLHSNGTVKTWFSPETDVELRPLLAKNLDTAEYDFVRTYGLTSTEATAFRRRIERDGCASTAVAV
jgi:hypothetical protein